jgi:hypothetical protein
MTHTRVSIAILSAALAGAALGPSCARESAFPRGEDLPVLMAEAAGSGTVPRSQDDPARRAVRLSLRVMLHLDSVHVEEVGTRVRRPHLQGYFMLSDSYVGGSFPRQTADVLREIERLTREYVASVQGYPEVLREMLESTDLPEDRREALVDEMSAAYAATQQTVIEVNRALERFVVEAAKLYEIPAGSPGAFKGMREGLEVSDNALMAQFNRQVVVVNRAGDELDALLRSMTPEQALPFSRMSLTTLVRE